MPTSREQLGAYQVSSPPIETQTLFEKQAQSIIEAEQRRHIVGDKLSDPRTPQHRALPGHLTATWRAADMEELLA